MRMMTNTPIRSPTPAASTAHQWSRTQRTAASIRSESNMTPASRSSAPVERGRERGQDSVGEREFWDYHNVTVNICVRKSSCSAMPALRQSSLYTHSPSLSTSKQLLRASQYPLNSLHGVPTGNRRPILPGNMLASCMFSMPGSPLLPLAMAMVERHLSPIMQHTSHTFSEEHSQLSAPSTTQNDPLHIWEGGGRGEGSE